MNRLRDRIDPVSATEAEAIALLRSIQSYHPTAGMKQRVRMRLVLRAGTRPVRFFRPAVFVGLLLVAAGASAAIGGAFVVSTQGIRSATRSEVTMAPRLPILRVPRSIAEYAPDVSTTVPTVRSDDLPLALEIDAPSRLSARPPDVNRTQAAARAAETIGPNEPGKPAEVAKPSEDVKLVFDAMQALRRDGQPDVASRQLEEYLRRYPVGTLAEEALALSIEAANVRGDARAKELANKYLSRYPSGRFRKAAERVRSRFSP